MLGTQRQLSLWERRYDWPLIILYLYFIFSCVAIERLYCFGSGPMDPNDNRFMMPETYDFSRKYNPLFLERPEWMRVATCFSAFGLLPFHVVLLVSFTFGINSVRPVAFVFAGVKMYALLFYHYMQFHSPTPPPELIPYWLPEGPYLAVLAASLYRMRKPQPFAADLDTEKKTC